MKTLSQVQIVEVWRGLGGPEPRHGRAPAWWRGSGDLNVSIDFDRCVFYDHVTNRGGGVLALVETALDCDRSRALAWLEIEGFIESRRFTRNQKHEHARRREEATDAAREIEHWCRALVSELNARKAAAIDARDDAALRRAASLCNVLENGSPGDIVREFMRQKRTTPQLVARFVAVGRARDHEDRVLAARVVLMLARVGQPEAIRDAE